MTATAIMDVVSEDEGQEPSRQLFTIDDLDALEDNGDARRFEIIDEVVSPSSVTHDRTTKRALYAGMGIEHYWIVEQVHELRLTALRLKGPEFEEVAVFGRDDTVELEEPFPVRFRLAELVA